SSSCHGAGTVLRQPIPPHTRQPNFSTISQSGEFRHAEIHFEGSIMSRWENPLEFERRNGPTAGKTTRSDRESAPKGSDRVGIAGKGNAKAWNSKAPRKSDRKDLIESETPKGSPEESPRG
ncbi:hypothetical protein ACWGSF_21125, partial [Bacillus velezensis]